MTFNIIQQDITTMKVDVIVNAANIKLKRGGGVCGAIFQAAGDTELQAACDKLAPIQTGESVMTAGFNLPARNIIHAVGPIYQEQAPAESERLLRATYLNALELAADHSCQSIAFPLISSGIYGYPKAAALHIALEVIENYLKKQVMEVYLVLFDQESMQLSQKLSPGK